MRVRFTRLAEADLEEIGDYIARANHSRALSFLEELRAACRSLSDAPLANAARPELGANLRSRAYGSYVIFYAVAPENLIIVRVLHGARDLARIFGESG